MGVFEQFPYSNFHDLNLDWILKAMKEAVSSVDAFTGKVTELDNKVDDMQQEIAIVNSMIQQINSEIAKIENGQYVTLYLNSIKNWIDDNIQRLVADIV
jgi:methyl-accepting chemotaxis protein